MIGGTAPYRRYGTIEIRGGEWAGFYTHGRPIRHLQIMQIDITSHYIISVARAGRFGVEVRGADWW